MGEYRQNIRSRFCPRCGTLTENGFCRICASKRDFSGPGYYGQAPEGYGWQPDFWKDPYYAGPLEGASGPYTDGGEKPKRRGIPAAIAIICLILALVIATSSIVAVFISSQSGYGASFHSMEGLGKDQEPESSDEAPPKEPESESETVYVPSAEDEFYETITDYENKDVSYTIKRETYGNHDQANSIDINVEYISLSGENIKNLDSINRAIEERAMFFARDFPLKSGMAQMGDSYVVTVKSFVTYNDEEVLSLVMDEQVVVDDNGYMDLYSINIDLKRGLVLENTALLDMDRAFAQDFKKRSLKQNGEVDFLDNVSDQDLADMLVDPDSLIIFYTPLGMEVGVNLFRDGFFGWVTVSYKDYKDYIKKL